MSKFDDQMKDLAKNTSGGAHDAVTFSGKGLSFLRDLFKSAKGKGLVEDDEDEDEVPEDEETHEDEDLEDEDEEMKEKKTGKEKPVKKSAAAKANVGAGDANGDDPSDMDEDPEDPSKGKAGTLITNKGKKVTPKGAVSKSYEDEDENPLVKGLQDYQENFEEVIDATDALAGLVKHVGVMAKSVTATNANISELQNTMMVLAKGLQQSLKAQAALAADLQLIKSQPTSRPATGFVVMEKGEGKQARTLSKSDVQDVVTEAMNAGEVNPMVLARLQTVRSQADLKSFVSTLPEDVQARL